PGQPRRMAARTRPTAHGGGGGYAARSPGPHSSADVSVPAPTRVIGPSVLRAVGARRDAAQDAVEDGGALLARRRWVLGSRDVERAFVGGADQEGGEGGAGLRDDRAGVHRRLQRELDQAQTVTAGQVPPRLPAEHGGGVEQDDPLDLG